MEATAHASAPVLAAYRYCEAITGQQARNFAYGIRLLPTDKRQAMSALYAFSRRIDDIGDGTLEPTAKQGRLEDTRALLARVKDGRIDEDDTDPVAVALSDAARRFPLPLEGLDELIDGVLMDVHGETYETWDELKVYCRCVAGAIEQALPGRVRHGPGCAGRRARLRVRRHPRPRAPTDQHSQGRSRGHAATGVPICPPRTSPSSAARPTSGVPYRRPARTSPAWCTSR